MTDIITEQDSKLSLISSYVSQLKNSAVIIGDTLDDHNTQLDNLKDDMDNNKDILAIRFPSNNDIQHNKIINNMLFGKGIMYENNKIWYPTEVWIYSPIH